MPRLTLGVHAGVHDAAAAVFEDYRLKAAVSLERITRRKGDGSEHPDKAIDEVLAIAGAGRSDVDAVAYSRMTYPQRYFRNLQGMRWLKMQYRAYVRGKPNMWLDGELARAQTHRA